MRIIAISDIHGHLNNVKLILEIEGDIDLLLFSGDISPYRYPKLTKDLLKNLIDMAKDYVNDYILAIPGNVDYPEDYDLNVDEKYVNLNKRIFEHQNIVFIGYGGSTPTPFNTVNEIDEEIIDMELNGIIKNIEINNKNMILLTHSPPYDTKCDITYTNYHAGSKSIRKFITKYSPILNICGHIHESRCIDRIERTIIVNPGPLNKGLYSVIEINGSINVYLNSI